MIINFSSRLFFSCIYTKISNLKLLLYNRPKETDNTPKKEKGKHMNDMNTSGIARLIKGLRAAGWSDKDINDFILYIETGDEKYKPKEKND